jgi:hypothetical protein
MNKTKAIVAACIFGAAVRAATVTDDFNRDGRGMHSSGATVGSGWQSSQPLGQWGIENQRLVVNLKTDGDNTVLYNTGTELNGCFTVQADVKSLAANTWAGLAFHVQDAKNFYYFRYKSGAVNYALVRMIDGKSVILANLKLPGCIFEIETDYTLTVRSSVAGSFDYEVKETGTGAVLASGTAEDSFVPLAGGYAGVLQTTQGPNRNSFDNFVLEVTPAP